MRILWIGEGSAAVFPPHYIVDRAEDLEEADLYLLSRHFEAVVFFGMADERRVIRWLTPFKTAFPHTVTVLAGCGAEAAETLFLEAGGDLFIPEAQSRDSELIRLRIERLALACLSDEPLRVGELELDPDTASLRFRGEGIALDRLPFRTLQHLLLKRGRIVGKEQIISALYENPEYVRPGTIDVVVNTIRRRLDYRYKTAFIKTVRNRGYGFVYNA